MMLGMKRKAIPSDEKREKDIISYRIGERDEERERERYKLKIF